MGIDSAAFEYSPISMYDQKAISFNVQSQRWLSNQAHVQDNMMNYAESEQTGVNSPLELDALQNFWHPEALGTMNNRLPSNSRSTSSDTANDPTPDGNGMEFGNDTCHSPYADSLGSFQGDEDNIYTSGMGTPNSFIDHCEAPSPDLFSNARERLLSTSSAYTYSPYSPKDGMFPTIDSSSIMCPEPLLQRQDSLAMVEEVLRSAEHPGEPFTFEGSPIANAEPSPVTPYREDSSLPPYPSPSFSAHFNASTVNAEVLTSSQTEEFFEELCAPEAPETLQCEGSPNTADSTQDCSSNCNNNNSSNGDSQNPNTPTCTENEQVAQMPPPVSTFRNCPVPLTRDSSALRDLFTDSMPTNSLDASEMMKDFMDSTNPVPVLKRGIFDSRQSPELTTVEVAQLAEAKEAPKSPKKQRGRKSPVVASKKAVVEMPSTSKVTMADDDSNIRRQRNNEACRLSRKRRRDKKLEMDSQVDRYSKENVDLAKRIVELETECKRVKQEILSAMTNTRN